MKLRSLTLAVTAFACVSLPPAYANTETLNPTVKVHPLYVQEASRGDYTSASLRDEQEFLWVATDNGLKRYDGYNFRIYTRDPETPGSIGSDSIRHLMLQSDGTLWASGATLNRYNRETDTFTSYSVTDSSPIRDVYEDENGIFWLAGEGFGLIKFDPQRGEVVGKFLQESNRTHIWNITQHGTSPRIWLASLAGLLRFNTQTYEVEEFHLPLDVSTGVEAIRALEEDKRGQLWAATHTGLFVLNPATGDVKHYKADPDNKQALSTNALWSVKQDSKGQLWIGTEKMGVHKYLPETDSFAHFRASSFDEFYFPRGTVAHISEDKKGHLWFSVGGYGMYRLSEHLEKFRAFEHSFDSDNSLIFNNVLGLLEDSRGYIWIGTDGGGLDRFDPRTHDFKHYRHNPRDPNSISSDAIISLAEDSKGYIWIGTWGGGLNRLDPETEKFTRIERNPNVTNGQTLGDNNVFRIVVDAQDRLLLSIWRKGLQIYDTERGTFETYFPLEDTNNSGIRSGSITDILPTPEGKFWIAGYKGLELFSPDEGTFSHPQLPVTSAVADLHLDHEGFIWIATNKNLLRYNPVAESMQEFSTKDGLSDNYVVSIEQDDLGFLWVGTNRGLNRLDPRSREIVVYDEHDGLAGSQFNRFSHLKTRSGNLYFGGTEGFTYFNPEDLPRNEHAPKIHITGIDINQQRLDAQTRPGLYTGEGTEALVIPRSQRDIAFQFSATNFVAPVKNMYRYRLNGLEEDWINVDSRRRRAQYSNLDPGSYQFQVVAANNEGVWAGSAQTVDLVVLPAWWQTWWARGTYLGLALLAMYGYSYWRLQSNQQRQKQLQVLVSKQTAKLKEANRSIVQLNSELEQRVAHRTRELSNEIEERKESEAKANYIAYHDALTGLYNRAWLFTHLQHLIDQSAESHHRFALLFVAGDHFRKINDTYGHIQGDLLLKAAAQRLLKVLPEGSHAIRLGSDEFTLVVDQAESQEQIELLAETILATFKQPFMIDKLRMSLSVSIGCVISDRSYTEPSQVLRNANIAMQRAKDRGRGLCQLFDQDILEETLEVAALEADLKLALQRNEFAVVYQPIVIIETGELNGFEVLIRWHHPKRGFVPPDKFIAMAESLGLISDIGLWVLEKACEQLQTWQSEFKLPVLPTIAVNLSPIQLEHADLLDKVDQVFAKTGVRGEHIKFEITESALMKHTGTVDSVLESLRERGIELAIDDFGTGYSSLSYLDQLPVQVLKIDRSFVDALTDAKGSKSGAHEIVRATTALAHNLKMRVVAEGIETQEQMDALKTYKCDYGQGYFIARPLSPQDATQFLARSRVSRLPKSPDTPKPRED